MQDLSIWLWQLVRGEVEQSAEAANQLARIRTEAQMRLYEEGNSKVARNKPWGDYATFVQASINAPGFPTRNFLLELIEFMDIAQELRMSLWREEHARQNALSDRISARLTPESSDEERQKV